MKKFWKIGGWVLFVAGVFVVLGFAKSEHQRTPSNEPEIEIIRSSDHDFVTKQDVLDRLNNIGYSFQNDELKELDLPRIEQELEEIPGVQDAQAYTYVNGKLRVNVEQRKPVIRIVNFNGTSCYMDSKGISMPLSRKYHARIPVVTGFVYEPLNFKVNEILASDSLMKTTLLDDFYEVAKYIDTNEFWQHQLVQIHVSKEKELELIPRVGKQRILFGNAENAAAKFQKLKLFYERGIESNRLNQYDTLNVKYKGQIVCSKI